jgi:hypothetical protein
MMARGSYMSVLTANSGLGVDAAAVAESPLPLMKTPLRRFPAEGREFEIPDTRALRSMSRNACLLTQAAMGAKSQLRLEDPYRVGLYVAVENGSVEYSAVQSTMSVDNESFAESYRQLRNPKMYLKQLPNLAAAQVGIFLGILGPMGVFTHSRWGAVHALDQARMDLSEKKIDQALVLGAFSLEDPLNVLKNQMRYPGRGVSEAAFAAVLNQHDDTVALDPVPSLEWSYGILTQFFEDSLNGPRSKQTSAEQNRGD